MIDFNDPQQMRDYLSTHGWKEYKPDRWVLSGPHGRPFSRKLDDRAVSAMRTDREGGALLTELSERYGVTVSCVSRICAGNRRK